MRKQPLGEIPENTARVAKASFRKGNVYMKIADELGTIFDFSDFVSLFSSKGQPAEHPVRLALTVVLQFAESLSDRDAADAVRGRIDWKYLLHLDLEDPGFDFSVLSEFRDRLIKHDAGVMLLDKLIEAAKEKGLIKTRGKQRTDSTHVLAAIRVLNRLELVHETMRNALETLATVSPDWLQKQAHPEWYDRYGRRMFSMNAPKTDKGRDDLARKIGSDGFKLLEAIDAAKDMLWLSEIPDVKILHRVWTEQYTQPPEPPKFRDHENQPPSAERIASPHDPDARYSTKRSTEWTGYKAHLTETCDQGLPRIITNVETTVATTPDFVPLKDIHTALSERNLLPSEHLLDAGYMSADNLVTSLNAHQVKLIGPPLPDSSWQSRSKTGLDKSQFVVEWEIKKVTCPGGKTNKSWKKLADGRTEARFSQSVCRKCPARKDCTNQKTDAGNPAGKRLMLRPQEEHEALQQAREFAESEEFKEQYRLRSGIEGTLSQAVREHGMRESRYIGLAKTQLQHLLTAVAVNFTKIGEWMLGTPLAETRKSRFRQLKAA